MNNITLFLMGEKGYNTLIHLIKNDQKEFIDFIVIAMDSNIRADFYYQIQKECINNNIKFIDRKIPYTIQTKYSIAISWRWIIKLKDNQRLIVLHDSLLPRLRGFNPLVTALINGDSKIGVTAIFANEEFDKGDILHSESVNITYPIKIQQAINLISNCYIAIIDHLFLNIVNGVTLTGTAQQEHFATYSVWRNDDDYKINWNNSADQIVRFINSVGYPYNGAQTIIDNEIFIIEDAEIIEDIIIENRAPGKVIFKCGDNPVVICGNGLLKIINLYNTKTKQSALPLAKFRTLFK
jgi:methionyl-tRNA formyltransferase